jgi:hypothetical protein
MQVNALTVGARIAVGAVLGLAALVALFVISVCVLSQMTRLDYTSSITSLILCAALALAVFSAVEVYGPLKASVTGENRKTFTTIAGWVSTLLPIETFNSARLRDGLLTAI